MHVGVTWVTARPRQPKRRPAEAPVSLLRISVRALYCSSSDLQSVRMLARNSWSAAMAAAVASMSSLALATLSRRSARSASARVVYNRFIMFISVIILSIICIIQFSLFFLVLVSFVVVFLV